MWVETTGSHLHESEVQFQITENRFHLLECFVGQGNSQRKRNIVCLSVCQPAMALIIENSTNVHCQAQSPHLLQPVLVAAWGSSEVVWGFGRG